MKSNDKSKNPVNYAKIRAAKNPSKSIQQSQPNEQKPDYFYGYFGDNLNEKNMSYIQALKKPFHNKAFSYDYKPFQTSVNVPKIENSYKEEDVVVTNGNDADVDEEEKTKINRSFSVEIVENITPEKNPSALYVGFLPKSSEKIPKKSESVQEKKPEFINFINDYITYFEENDKTIVPNSSIMSTKRKKNYHYSMHNEPQKVDEMNSFFVLQNKKLIKSKTIIEDMKQTQKTLVTEIADHQGREKEYIMKLQEMEEERERMIRDFNELHNKLKVTQELLAKEKIDNENSLFALKKILAEKRTTSHKTSQNPQAFISTKSQNNFFNYNDSANDSFSIPISKLPYRKLKDSLHLNNISEVESNTLEMSSDMEISYDKDLYLMLKKLKNAQVDTITPKYHHYQRSMDTKKQCYTENSTIQQNYNRKSFHDTSRLQNKPKDWFSLHLNNRTCLGKNANNLNLIHNNMK